MHFSTSELSTAEFHWLEEALRGTFGNFDKGFLEAMKPQLDWVRLPAGGVLFKQGSEEDSIYFVVAGRMRAFVRDDFGYERPLGDIRRGETLGEMALLTQEPRSATVVAIRDSLLVRLSRESYEKLVHTYPLVSSQVARCIVERMRKADDPRAAWARPATIAMLPLTRGVGCEALARELAPLLSSHGNVDYLDSTRLKRDLGIEGHSADGDGATTQRVSRWIDKGEAGHDLVLLVSDEPESAWARHCLRHADEVLWLADVDGEAIGVVSCHAVKGDGQKTAQAKQTLLLRHPSGTQVPQRTALWLERHRPDGHLHLRRGHLGDLERLARIMMGRAVGLVFGGGGARGFAHLGVLKAIEETGIPIDYVGGCSIGAVMAAYAAFDRPADELIVLARRAFSKNPTGDLNPLPVISLIKGKRLRATVENGVRELAGLEAGIEDTWKPLFCIASNYSRAAEAILERGNLAKAIRASVSIPAALPPVVIDGDLMIDGGTFNNFPTDVMARKGVGFLFGCDLMRDSVRKMELDEVPSAGALAWDKLRPRSKRRYRLPNLSSIILNVSILHSQSKIATSRAHADVCFTPTFSRIGMLHWRAFDKAVEAGYSHARDVLSEAKALRGLNYGTAVIKT